LSRRLGLTWRERGGGGGLDFGGADAELAAEISLSQNCQNQPAYLQDSGGVGEESGGRGRVSLSPMWKNSGFYLDIAVVYVTDNPLERFDHFGGRLIG
jgi:hypothetical protein